MSYRTHKDLYNNHLRTVVSVVVFNVVVVVVNVVVLFFLNCLMEMMNSVTHSHRKQKFCDWTMS